MADLYLGVDLGGTNTKAALVDAEGNILNESSVPTNLPRQAEAVCDDIAALCTALADGVRVHGIGVGCPGTVDGGVVRYSNNLNWHDFAMADYLQGKTGLPVRLANDANAAALGEALAGCAQGAESAVIVTLGTGVGGGVVLNGKLLTGYTGAASEPGHPESALHTVAANGTVNGRTAFDAAELGDAAAKQVVDDYIHYLAVGIANLINMFFPQVIGLSGGVANQGENLLRPLRAAVQPMIFGDEYAKKHTTLTTCTLGYRAGVIGAALLNRV